MHLYIDIEVMLLCFIVPLKQVRMLSREKSVFPHYDYGQILNLTLTRANTLVNYPYEWPTEQTCINENCFLKDVFLKLELNMEGPPATLLFFTFN